MASHIDGRQRETIQDDESTILIQPAHPLFWARDHLLNDGNPRSTSAGTSANANRKSSSGASGSGAEGGSQLRAPPHGGDPQGGKHRCTLYYLLLCAGVVSEVPSPSAGIYRTEATSAICPGLGRGLLGRSQPTRNVPVAKDVKARSKAVDPRQPTDV